MRKRLQSFAYAFNGFLILIKEEANARIHLLATLVVVALGFYFDIAAMEWIALILCIALVFAMEFLNSAIENLADFVSPQKHALIKKAKDLAAGGVLIAAIAALVVGLVVFVPKFIAILH